MIQVRHIPHYIIESRNLFNSKMTEHMSMKIVDVLRKYDMTHVFTLHAFEYILALTHCNSTLLKRESLASTIMACFGACVDTFHSLAWTHLFVGIHTYHTMPHKVC